MAEVTKNFGLKKPDRNEYVHIETINKNMDIIDEKLGEVAAKEVVLTPDFNNPLCWVGCTRVTPPETEAGVTTEEWKDSATRTITRARSRLIIRLLVDIWITSFLKYFQYHYSPPLHKSPQPKHTCIPTHSHLDVKKSKTIHSPPKCPKTPQRGMLIFSSLPCKRPQPDLRP